MPIITLPPLPLTSGPMVSLSGATAAVFPQLAGTVVYDDVVTMNQTIELGFVPDQEEYGGATAVAIVGLLQRRVVRSAATGLDAFYYRVTLDPSSVAHVRAVVLYPLAGTTFEVDFRPDGLGDRGPDRVFFYPPTPFSDFDGTNPELRFNFDGEQLQPGQSSKFFLVLPYAHALPSGDPDFAQSGSTGFTAGAANIALRITDSLFPVGPRFDAPAASEDVRRPWPPIQRLIEQEDESVRHPLRDGSRVHSQEP